MSENIRECAAGSGRHKWGPWTYDALDSKKRIQIRTCELCNITQVGSSRHVRILSDGTPMGTKVIDEDTGTEIERITGVRWSIDVDDFARATIEVLGPRLDVQAEAEVEVQCPSCDARRTQEAMSLDQATDGNGG